MSTKAPVKTQAKTPAAPAAARMPQPPVPEPEHVAERPDIAAQLEGAARLGHSFGALGVDLPAPPIIQRQELPEEEEEELQLKREPAAIQRQELPEEEEEELMMKPEEGRVGPQGGQVPPEVESAINCARGGGQPLERRVQRQMGAVLGHDFSGVRVHTDMEADALNRQLNAKAFTTGWDIFFKRGEYDPVTRRGRQRIAHELSHVIQQGNRRVREACGSLRVGAVGGDLEREAEAKARAAVQWEMSGEVLEGNVTSSSEAPQTSSMWAGVQRITDDAAYDALFSGVRVTTGRLGSLRLVGFRVGWGAFGRMANALGLANPVDRASPGFKRVVIATVTKYLDVPPAGSEDEKEYEHRVSEAVRLRSGVSTEPKIRLRKKYTKEQLRAEEEYGLEETRATPKFVKQFKDEPSPAYRCTGSGVLLTSGAGPCVIVGMAGCAGDRVLAYAMVHFDSSASQADVEDRLRNMKGLVVARRAQLGVRPSEELGWKVWVLGGPESTGLQTVAGDDRLSMYRVVNEAVARLGPGVTVGGAKVAMQTASMRMERKSANDVEVRAY